ncbi:ComEC family competence protein [Limibaculum sp. FT325]|uniref:ComEC/Rec2 family competence protein n=1 Tax=Thermohalobaculum sediminis TaxID=2939436 RepID=UPI0020C119FB|nr:ComEC/Rec2 family competence protein [Limibaculum sediminis]MCL5777478.1 ComEC family competence protein [Limibaculum sediminis]
MGKVALWRRIGGRIDWGAALAVEMRRAGLWFPVLMGGGIWVYFALPSEPPAWTAALALLPAAAAALPAIRGRLLPRAVVLAALAFAAGYALALGAAHRIAAPVVERPAGLTIEGRVLALDRSASEAPRLLVDRVTLFGVEPEATPRRVRVALLGTDFATAPRPGETVRLHATLLPPGDPVEPGAFDFGERAFFEGIGAVGYTRNPVLCVPPDEAVRGDAGGVADRLRLWLAAVRFDLSEHLRAALPGPPGAFAAAIMLGDRVGIAEADAEALRISSLAHLLAISGLHMGLLTGLVFAAARLALAIPPCVALRWPTKKLAAVAALAAGAGYLMLSGATVATQRAFVMVAVAFLAILFDRPAISLRGLALAAAVVLAVRPVSLFDVGFQMSFAATLGLVAGYEELSRLVRARRERLAVAAEAWGQAASAPSAEVGESGEARLAAAGDDGVPGPTAEDDGGPRLHFARALESALGRVAAVPRARRLARAALVWAAGLVFTSLVAGLATAPFSTYHFNRLAPYGLVANLGAVPAMGLVIAPAAVLTALLAPLGLAALPLAVLGAGIEWVLRVAHWTAGQPGADRVVQAGAAGHLALIALGGLWLALWRGGWRLAGLAPLVAGTTLWATDPPPRPPLLVAPGGALVGLLGPESRALDHPKRQSYAAETWLRRDGDAAEQATAAARPGLGRTRRTASGRLTNGWRLEVLHATRPEPAEIARLCAPRTVLIARGARDRPVGGCMFYGRNELARAGALAVWPDGEGIRVEESAARASRLWHRRRASSGQEGGADAPSDAEAEGDTAAGQSLPAAGHNESKISACPARARCRGPATADRPRPARNPSRPRRSLVRNRCGSVRPCGPGS